MRSQALAVIRGEHDQRVLINTSFFDKAHQASYLLIDVCDFAVVGMRSVLLPKRRWRVVRIVRIVQVSPQKEWPFRGSLEPADGLVDHLGARALQLRYVQGV